MIENKRKMNNIKGGYLNITITQKKRIIRKYKKNKIHIERKKK